VTPYCATLFLSNTSLSGGAEQSSSLVMNATARNASPIDIVSHLLSSTMKATTGSIIRGQ
jgi:hypothetical protein